MGLGFQRTFLRLTSACKACRQSLPIASTMGTAVYSLESFQTRARPVPNLSPGNELAVKDAWSSSLSVLHPLPDPLFCHITT